MQVCGRQVWHAIAAHDNGAGMDSREGQATLPEKEAKKIEGAANWYSDIL